MTAAVTRDLTVVYGGLSMGGSTDYLITAPWTLDGDYQRAVFTCRVAVTAASAAALKTACDALETEFREPYQSLTVAYGASNAISWTHASGTGCLATPSFRVLPEIQTELSRHYEVKVQVQLPANYTGMGYLRRAFGQVETKQNGYKTLRLTGTYTAGGSSSASTNYTSGIDTYAATWTSALGGTWERTARTYTPDDQDKEAQFIDILSEVPFKQSTSSTDVAAVKDQQLVIMRTQVAPGDLSDALRLIELVATYSVTVDKSQSTDLDTLWTGTAEPLIYQQIRAFAGNSNIAVVESRPFYDVGQNRLSGVVRAVVASTSNILMHRRVTERETLSGRVLIPAWSRDGGAKVQMQGVSRQFLRIIDDTMTFGGSSGGGSGAFNANGGSMMGIFGIGEGAIANVGSTQDSMLGIYSIPEGPAGYLTGADIYYEGGSGGGGGGAATAGGSQVLQRSLVRSEPQRIGIPGYSVDITIQTSVLEYEIAGSGGGLLQPGGGSASSGAGGMSA